MSFWRSKKEFTEHGTQTARKPPKNQDPSPGATLSPMERALDAIANSYGDALAKLRATAIDQLRKEAEADKDGKVIIRLKPLFKEWLELRCDASAVKAEERQKMDLLVKRAAVLVSYLKQIR